MTTSLRIAVFAHEFPALSETFVLSQVTGLIEFGHDVTIFANGPRPDSRVHSAVVRYNLRDRTFYPGISRHWLPRLIRVATSFMRHVGRKRSILTHCLNVRRYGRDAMSLRLLHWADRIMDHSPFDVLYCHFGPIGQFVAKLRDAGALTGRLVTVFHGVDISAYVHRDPDYYRFLFSVGDMFLPVSRAWRAKLIELGCNPEQIAVHRMGVDLNLYPFVSRTRKDDRPLIVLTVGRLVEKKGIAYGLEAISELVRQGVAVRYLVVGDGPLRPHLERMAISLGIDGYVAFLGWQEQTAVAALMQVADVLLAPSVTTAQGDQEGIPVTLMEGMATGMLVVSTCHSGIPELVEPDRSGILVPERDSRALGRALVRLTRVSDDWLSMSRAARDRILSEYEIGSLNRTLSERFMKLCGPTDGRSSSGNKLPRPITGRFEAHNGQAAITN